MTAGAQSSRTHLHYARARFFGLEYARYLHFNTPQLDNSSKADTRTKFAAAVAKLERMYYGTSLGEEGRAHVVRLLDQRAAG